MARQGRHPDSSDSDVSDRFDEFTIDRPDSPSHRPAVLRDASGSIACSSFVPPSVESPDSPSAPSGSGQLFERQDNDEDASTADDEEEYDAGPQESSLTYQEALNRARSAAPGHLAPPVPMVERAQSASNQGPQAPTLGRANVVHTRHHTPSTAPARPPAPRNWKTEISRRGPRSKAPFPPAPPRRAGTSFLHTAISQRDAEYASSSSSDEDGECVPAADVPAQAQADRARKEKEGRDRAQQPRGWRKAALLGASDADDRFRRFLVGNENYQSKGKIKKDGRLRITVNETTGTGYIAKALGAAVHKMKPGKEPTTEAAKVEADHKLSPVSSFNSDDIAPRPRLNIVIMVIGSRGDVQPFLKIGRVLKEDYGHRVRIATHPTFREYVERSSGLEFFSVGGDPSELMAFMVKNPGMIPTLETVRAGDIGKRRAAMAEMFDGLWRACINATDDEKDRQNLKMMGSKDPFVADAIIANPPSFAHIHCAEALGIPLHLMFTFPYSPTQAFPHPLALIKKSNVDPGYTNFMSYPLVEMMIWQGLGDLVNNFRVKTLSLDPVSTLWAPGSTYRLHVPFTYLWSPGLVPKPSDWGDEIDISGFVYLDLASSFTPSPELEAFLANGEAPIYIGFGSIVVDDADRFTQMIFEAVKKAGVRALVSRGWGGLGSEDVPDNIFMLENTPHDWLFPRVKACVIHGGAGTTAIALKLGCPTMVVPFFGDQHFWGKMIWKSGVGPEPVPYKFLTADNLAEGIKYCLCGKAVKAATEIARSIELEGDGAVNAVRSFHKHLNLRGPTTMRCSILKDQIAVWQPKKTHVKLSPLAADILVEAGFISWRRLRLIRHHEWNDFEGPGEPVTGLAGSITRTLSNVFKGVGSVPYRMAKKSRKYKTRLSKKEKDGGKRRTNGTQNGHSEVAEADIQQDASGTDPNSAVEQGHTSTRAMQGGFAGDVTSGVGMTASALAKAPVDLSLALAQGFHNAPRLYGDDTVRKPLRITGIQSGLKAARKEFVYGVYDGFTGVVRLPIRGARNRGVIGFIKGTGTGLLGLVVKNIAAIIGPFGYALKGVSKQIERRKNPSKFIRRARILEGQREYQALSSSDKKRVNKQVVEGYHTLRNLCDAITNEERQRGLAGQLDRVFVDTALLFEDVDIAKKALRALRRGESLEQVIRSPVEAGSPRGSRERKDRSGLRKSGSLGTKSLRP
ncbi:Sterol 3-beta-glucosyltransferase UGT80B1-like protein [Hapsidospora chrysogenum ATCC 11550]|uniref:Sterol 3-beta-glucosyltransferase UGT80B1-like protein n=1 Tax=Hapsidospora chrysogenum (strain ATCC 11550 / CBS 779.69 / DSM 880 / IAM 14645 / JCM 23072 / IMI 49137) TaxID=857340 RepID=A0A086T1I3_HAPC1|nr:Sterol 3-beta-glucosyltransferase UGT80B1-like protein [Hapsidospora chrysogenum ATCC 11550]